MNRTDRGLLVAFALVQAVLYCSLMPLWEGFDEAWHYGYVQQLATMRTLPVLGQTTISRELWESMLSAPASHVVTRALPELEPYDAYFRLTPEARLAERRALESLPRDPLPLTARGNYESQQAPLAYAFLAPFGLALQRASIPVRILWLRLVTALATVLGIFAASRYLFRMLGLPAPYAALSIFCIFACQMYWATTARITNDGAALVLITRFFGAALERARPLLLAFIAAVGLITKASFLPLALFALCLIGWRNLKSAPAAAAIMLGIAGPWYIRNLVLYHDLTGLQMSLAGIRPQEALAALFRIDWTRTIPYMLRATLWTGNNSFTTFSAITLNCLLALFAVGLVRYAVTKPLHPVLLGSLSVVLAAIVYVAGNDVVWLHGASAGPCPWYSFPLFIPLVGLSLLGLSRARRLGRPVAIGIAVLTAYICVATYVIKLIPLYAGYPEGKSTPGGIASWYGTHGREISGMLATISLAPPLLIYVETAVVSALALTLGWRLGRSC